MDFKNILEIRKVFKEKLGPENRFLFAVMLAVTILFVLILYPNLAVKKYYYNLGDVVQRDVKARSDFFVEDSDATAANRRKAVEAVFTVYDHDTALGAAIARRLNDSFSSMRDIIQKDKLAKAQPEQVQDVKKPSQVEDNEALSLHRKIGQKRNEFEEKIGIKITDGDFKILEKEEFSKTIQENLAAIVTKILANGVVANKEVLLGEQDKGIALRNVETGEEKKFYSLKRLYGPDQAKTMVRIIGQPILKNMNYPVMGVIVDLSQRLISPNITMNKSATNDRKKAAGESVKPFLYKIKAGEMLLREGDRVTELQLKKLKALQAQVKNEQLITSRIGTAMVIICLLIVMYFLYIKDLTRNRTDHKKNILFLASVLVLFLFLTKVSASLSDGLAPGTSFSIPALSMYFAIPLASGAMTVCLFMGMNIAIPFAIVLAICSTVIFNNRIDYFIFFLLSSFMGAYWIQDCRERVVFIKAGLKLGLLNIFFAAAANVYGAELAGMKILWDFTFAIIGGVISGVVTAGIAPLVEGVFGYTTDIKLMELVNLDRPILKRLMIEAPGTYHHSIIVGSMVEAAASAINANPLLAKVCAYYHDIGKVNKPLYFIENQTGGKNKHDKLAPSMSSLILISHVKDGVEIAKKNKLGRDILHTIRQHHGTSLIKYFFEKAKQLKGEDSVNIDDFRYPGPKPQTREAGLVMLGDGIEAASRTLDNPTPSRIQGLVQNMINKVFSDGQLDDCELTLKDLHNIAKSFIKILDGIYHHRIEYPESPASPGGKGVSGGKGKNGSIDRQQAKQPDNKNGQSSGDGAGHLKRLGQS